MKAEEEKHMGEGEDEARPWREGQSRGAPRGAVLASRVKPRGKPAGRFERGHSAWRSTSQEKQLGVEGAEGGEVGAGQRAVGRAARREAVRVLVGGREGGVVGHAEQRRPKGEGVECIVREDQRADDNKGDVKLQRAVQPRANEKRPGDPSVSPEC